MTDPLANIRAKHLETADVRMVLGYFNSRSSVAGAVIRDDLIYVWPNGQVKFYPQDGSGSYVIPVNNFSFNKRELYF